MSGRVSPVQPIVLVNLREHVHERVREAILARRFADGERLNERTLASDLGVSTTPLKEALRQLEAEGLVRTESRRGVFVTYGPRQAEEMSLARAALESMIARLAAKRALPEHVEKLGQHVDAMDIATRAGDIDRLIDLNELFHSEIHRASECDYLRRLQGRQAMYDNAARMALMREADERGRAFAEHREIYRAISRGDQDSAERVMRDHIVRSGRRHIEVVFQKHVDGEAP